MADPAEALGIGRNWPDDYDGAPRRPVGAVGRILVAAGALLVGFLLTSELAAGRSAARLEDERKQEVISLVERRRDRLLELRDELAGLRDEVAVREQGAAALVPELARERGVAALAAGLVGVTGPGVVVTLHPAPPSCTLDTQFCRIQDFDLQMTVNDLFAAGAEAVAVNDQRITATTAIRSAGEQITVNYRFIGAPYEVVAVGDPDALEDAAETSDTAADPAFSGADGLRHEVSPADALEVPAYEDDVRIERARPEGVPRP